MSKRRSRWMGLLAAALAAIAVASAGRGEAAQAPAASDQDLYTYVARWNVPRAEWNAVERYYASLTPAMNKLMEAGTISGWGEARSFVHEEGGSTHVNWLSAAGFAGLAKALDAIRAAAPPPVAFENSKHSDQILRSTVNGGKPGAGGTGMLWVARYELQPGQMEDFSRLFEEEIKPLFVQQVAAGNVLGYALNFEAVHTASPNVATVSYLLPDAAAIDKFQTALGRYQVVHPRAGAALEEVMFLAAHRDALFEVLAFDQK